MAYLFVHFTGEDENGEQIYFSVSKDGLHWMDLGSGPALVSDIGEKGVRDPFSCKKLPEREILSYGNGPAYRQSERLEYRPV